MKLWVRFAWASTFLVLMTVTAVGGLLFWAEKRQLLSNRLGWQKESVERFAQVCVESAAEQNDLILINYVRVLSHVPGFKYAYFADRDGKFTAHSDPVRMGKVSTAFAGDEDAAEVVSAVNYQGGKIGMACIGYSRQYFRMRMDRSMHLFMVRLLSIGSGVSLLGILGSFLFARSLTRPLARLTRATQAIGKGELGHRIPVHGGGEIGILGQSFNDMARKLQELDRLKSHFVSTVSHELRSPLNALRGFIQMFLAGVPGPVNDAQKENLDMMLQCTNRLGKFVDDILDSSKLEAGMMDFNMLPVNPCAVAREMAAFYRPQAQSQGIRLDFESSAAVPDVLADSDRIRQVLTNLLDNAFKFVPEGGHVRVWVQDEPGFVRFGVTDSGAGIPKNEIGKLFNKFEQVKAAQEKAKSKGTGLGLALCRQIVEAMGGRIAVESEPTQGTTFHFYLAKAAQKAAA